MAEIKGSMENGLFVKRAIKKMRGSRNAVTLMNLLLTHEVSGGMILVRIKKMTAPRRTTMRSMI